MFKRLSTIALAVLLLPVLAGTARADEIVTQFPWDRTGAEHLPCAGNAQWLLAPGTGITAATVGINDNDGEPDGWGWSMIPDYDPDTGVIVSWHITSTHPIALDDEIAVAYLGTTVSTPTLTLLDCDPVVSEPVWDIGFSVTSIQPVNVTGTYRLDCSNATVSLAMKQQFRGSAPLERHLDPTLADATTCRLSVKLSGKPRDPAPTVSAWAILG